MARSGQVKKHKAVIFDFFGVIGGDVAWGWYRKNQKNIPTTESELGDMLRLLDVGLLESGDFFDLLSNNSGIPRKDIEQAMRGADGVDLEVVELIKDIRPGHKTAILSNANRAWVENILELHGLREYFDAVIVSSMVGYAKPDPEIFEIVRKELGIEFSEGVFVDDGQHNVEAAKKLGLTAIRFESAGKLREDLRELGVIE